MEDISDANSLNALRFEVNQWLSGSNLDTLMAEPARLELAALSPELAEYYRTLELISNPSGGPLFTEPLIGLQQCEYRIWLLWPLHQVCTLPGRVGK